MIATISSNEAKVWGFNVASSKSIEEKLNPQLSQQSNLLYCCFNHTNQVIAISNSYGQINLYHTQTGQLLSTIPFEKDSQGQLLEPMTSSPIREVTFSSNSRYIAHTFNDSIIVWDLKKRSIRNRLLCPGSTSTSSSPLYSTSLSFFPEGTLVSGDSSGHIQLWNVSKSSSTNATSLVSNTKFDAISSFSRNTPPSASCVRASTSGVSKVVASYSSGHLCVFDAATTTLLRQQQVHASNIPYVAFSPKNPRLVASAGSDGKLVLLDTGSRGDLVTASIPLGAPATTLAFHEDAIHTAVGTQQGQVLIYDWRNVSKPVTVWEPHGSQPIVSVAFQTPAITSAPHAVSSSASSTASGISSIRGSTSSVPASVIGTPHRTVDEAISTPATQSRNMTTANDAPSVLSRTGVESTVMSTDATSLRRLTTTKTTPANNSIIIAGSPTRVTTFNSTAASRSAPSSPLPHMHTEFNTSSPKITTSTSPVVINTLPTTSKSTHTSSSRSPNTSHNAATTHTSAMKQTTERESLLSTLSEVTAGILSNNNHQHINTSSTISSHGVTPSVLNTPSVAVLVDQQSTTSYTQAPVATYTHTQVHTQANIDSVHSYLSPTTQKPSPVGTSDDNKSMTNTSNLNTSAISIRGSKPTVSFETNTPSSYVPATPTQSTSVSANKQNDISSNNKSSSSIYTNHATTPTTVPSTNYPLVEQAVQPVSQRQLQEELQLLRYDLHKELQTVIREQRREIEFAKEDTAELIGELAAMLRDLLQANEQLRRENEKLRGHMLIKYD